MMKSLTAQTPAQPGATGDPPYPSLAAAVAVDQPLPPTFANLMASTGGQPNAAAPGSISLTSGLAQMSTAPPATPAEAIDEASPSLTSEAPPSPQGPSEAVISAPPKEAPQQGDALGPGEIAAGETVPGELAPGAAAPGATAPVQTTPDGTAPVVVVPPEARGILAPGPAESPEPQAPESPALDSPAADAPVQKAEASDTVAPTGSPAMATAASVPPEPAIELDLLEGEKEEAIASPPRKPDQQVRIRREEDHVAILLPQGQAQISPDPAVDFIDSELWQALQQRLSGGEGFGPGKTPVYLYVQNCLLDTRQLQEMAEALDRFDLKLDRIVTSRRQTAVAAAMSGYSADQTSQLPDLLGDSGASPPAQGLAEPLYLQKTVRSGAEIRHPGSVIIVGDLNPGSSVIADGDILVWGRLRGVAHAGASGNPRSIILALKLEPTQLRIAESVALAPANPGGPLTPEVAYVTPEGIRIAPSASFSRPL